MSERDPVWDEITLLQDTWIRIWQSFMRWFSWHFAIHIATIYGVLGAVQMQEHRVKVSVFMFIFGFLGACAAGAMCIYDHSARTRLESLRAAPVANNVLFGGAILKLARWACLFTNILILLAWLIVATIAPTISGNSETPVIQQKQTQ